MKIKPFSCLFLLFAACNTNLGNSTLTEYHASDSTFRFSYPSTLMLTPSSSGILLQEPIEDSSDAYQENILLQIEPLPLKIPDSIYFTSLRTQIQIANPGVTLIPEKDTLIHNRMYSGFVFHFSSNEGIQFGVRQLSTIKDSTGYIFTSTYTTDRDSSSKELLYQLVHSFQFLK